MPRRVIVRPLVLSTVKVVPNDVKQSAALAAKACKGVAFASLSSENEKAMGKHMPVVATPLDKAMWALAAAKDVDTPPRIWQPILVNFRLSSRDEISHLCKQGELNPDS